MSQSVLDGIEDNEEKDEFEITLTPDDGPKPTKEQVANQRRIRREVKDFVHRSLGGVPKDYARTEARRVWGNRWRVNVVTVDKNGSTRYNHSYFIHYQFDHIAADDLCTIVKLYDNYDEVFSKKKETEDEQGNS